MTKILTIEDEAPIRENILEVLMLEGYEAIGAADGLEGIHLAHQYHPDLIVCDVTMPNVNGYGVLLNLRSDPTTSAIPFIFLTARAARNELREAMELGADDYLVKPFTPTELIAAVKSRLERHLEITADYEHRVEDFRGSLLHMLPHELRTPITTILGFSEIILSDAGTLDAKEIIELVSHIHSGGKRLYHLIENFLVFAQLEMLKLDPAESEKLRTYATAFPKSDIQAYVVAVASRYNRKADLFLDLADVEKIYITKDSLKKIMEELVDNAFKFSEPGTPVKVLGDVIENQYVLHISDRGHGMTSAHIADIGAYKQFQRKIFEQQGAGLGLVIAKNLAEIHGGTLTIESILQQRTDVYVSFDINRSIKN